MQTNRTYQQRVAAEVRAEMARQDVTAQSIAPAAHISPATLSRRLSGTSPFSVAELEAVAGALGVEPSDFLPARQSTAPVAVA